VLGRSIAVALALAACGRIGFDPHDDASLAGDGSNSPVGNRAFVTSSLQAAATFGGLAGADAVCTARASEAGLTGTFVAYISTSTVDATDRLAGARGWYRVDGTPLFDTVEDLLGHRMLLAPRIDEHGNDLVAMTDYVTTGTYEGAALATCSDYTDPADSATSGIASFTAGSFSNQKPVTCSELTRLYCFQTDFALPLAFTPAVGRLAFLSAAAFTPSAGLPAADAICTSEAQAAGLTGMFRALLPDTAPAAQRFDISRPTWIRRDGIALAHTAADFMAGALLAPLNVTAAGAYDDQLVMTGGYAPTAPVDPTRTCDAWTNAAGGNALGYAVASNVNAFTTTTADCVAPQRIYCLEN
jgi:hypothetical protein